MTLTAETSSGTVDAGRRRGTDGGDPGACPMARARGDEMNSSYCAEAREAARLLALSVEGALMQRLAQGNVDVEALRASLLTVAAGIAPPRRRFANCGMRDEFWQEVRRRWEADPRDGYAWLSRELDGVVSGAAIRKHVLNEGWSKE